MMKVTASYGGQCVEVHIDKNQTRNDSMPLVSRYRTISAAFKVLYIRIRLLGLT